LGPIDEEPSPRSSVQQLERWRPRAIARARLEIGAPLAKSFAEVIDDRRSIRQLKPPSVERLARLLWHGARTRETAVRSDGLLWQHRASPSAGGLHPIELFIVPASEATLLRYDPILHCLETLDSVDIGRLETARARLRAVADGAEATYLVLAADFARTEAVYHRAESLVWRDAGAMLATLHLTATAIELGFCMLGVHGNEVVGSVIGSPATLRAVGVAILGEPG
jgi:SagB-type dehydrogenase family enzyme